MSTYVYDPASENEEERLAALQETNDRFTFETLTAAGIAEGMRVLEVGAGRGSVAAWLCERVGPQGRVVATDIDTRFLDGLDLPQLEVRRHDIVHDPIEEQSFDLVHSRFVLEHLPEADLALSNMITALTPGGVLVAEDVDFMTPLFSSPDHVVTIPDERAELLARIREAMMLVLRRAGADPDFGRKLPALMADAGLLDVEGEGHARVVTARDPSVELIKIGMDQMRSRIIETGLVTEEEFQVGRTILDSPELVFVGPPVIWQVRGRRPT